MKTPTVAINSFALRQTAESAFSHFDGSDSVLIELAQAQFHQRTAIAEGMVSVPVPVKGFFTSVVTITEANYSKLVSVFDQRREGEEFYITNRIKGVGKSPAVSVELILYSHSTLKRTGDNSTEADWEVVSINASPTKEPTPQDPISIARNQLDMAGGTQREYEAKDIAEAIDFWSRHAMVEDGFKHVRIKEANLRDVLLRLDKAGIAYQEVGGDAGRHPNTAEEMTYLGVACTGGRFHKLIEDIADVVYPESEG